MLLRHSKSNTLNEGLKYGLPGCMGKTAVFSQYFAISWQRCKTGRRLPWITNRKSTDIQSVQIIFHDLEWPSKVKCKEPNFSGRSPNVCSYHLTNSDKIQHGMFLCGLPCPHAKKQGPTAPKFFGTPNYAHIVWPRKPHSGCQHNWPLTHGTHTHRCTLIRLTHKKFSSPWWVILPNLVLTSNILADDEYLPFSKIKIWQHEVVKIRLSQLYGKIPVLA